VGVATYIVLLNYTQQGIENIKGGPARLDAGKSDFQRMGAEIREFYLVMGRYDAVAVVEAPDDETVAKLAMSIGASGNVRTETLRAFTENEFRSIVSALP
jgi:uncharacterized protein with GYD domain